jgi:hypothetical protein
MITTAILATFLTCTTLEGDILKIDLTGNPRNGAQAFVEYKDKAGWAWPKEDNTPWYGAKVYRLEGNFPQESYLKISMRRQHCGRGSCHGGPIETSASLEGIDANLHFTCK